MINGGFFVINKEFFKFIDNDQTILEKEPLERIVKKNLQLLNIRVFGNVVDTKRDKDKLEEIVISSDIPWLKNGAN